MGEPYIVVSSITYAMKGRDVLGRKGCNAFIERAPRNISACGCHYLIKIRGCTLRRALEILQAAHVRVLSTGE